MPYAPDLAGAALDGRYELHSLIGEGTFGHVYRGVDRRLRRQVAIKVIKPWWGEDPDWRERFEREAQLLARLSHPGIVQIFDVGQSHEGLYYVAELVEGESLAARLRRGPVAPEQARRIAAELCRALAHMHAADIIHRDIKPANVLLGPGGRVKLGDFSIARLAEGSSDGPPTAAGTPKYMAPEQARGVPATAATDLYSLGVVLYEMVAGRPPFTGSSSVELALHHLQDEPPPLPDEVPRDLGAVIMRLLEKEPADRFASAAAAERALSGLAAGPSTAATAELGPDGPTDGDSTRVAPWLGPRRNVNPAASRRAVALVGGVALLVAAMLAAALLIGQPTTVRVPGLQGLTRFQATSALGRAKLAARFSERHSEAPAGTVIAQAPAARRPVDAGTDVAVVLSAGPAPVHEPSLSGLGAAAAQAELSRLRLHSAVQTVPAPGAAPGTVTGQRPPAGATVRVGSTVTLSVAETPSWRTVTTFSGVDGGRSAAFRIRGSEWRVVYTMSYVGTCTLLFVCDGPSAQVTSAGSGMSVASFGLKDGGTQTRAFGFGPGTYTIGVSPGGDTARWSIEVQDRY